VSFGGSSNMNTSQTNTGTEFTNQLSWFSSSNKHRIKFTTEARRDAFTLNQQTNTLGSFTFNSLADLEAQTPSSFSRQLSPRVRSGSQFVGGLLGDSKERGDNSSSNVCASTGTNSRHADIQPDPERFRRAQ
jgi:hypothetical protein